MPYGKIDSFDLQSRKWSMYVDRVKQFIALNEIKDTLHVATLITVRRQLPGEELNVYLQQLKHLASTCEFGAKLEENLRDQFVSGLASDEMRSRIFAEKKLDYQRAVELALALEAAERHAGASGSSVGGSAAAPGASGSGYRDGASDGGAGSVHRIAAAAASGRPRDQQSSRRPCWRCGKQHPADRCRYKNFNCDVCGARGHLRAMCKSATSYSASGYGKGKRNQFYLDTDSESEDSDFFNMCDDGPEDEPYVLKIFVDDVPLEFEVDTADHPQAKLKLIAARERLNLHWTPPDNDPAARALKGLSQ
ncbi:hypothetical protein NE865_11705 [Phthorimaea operculella]|nr:hypothetical protein NE865_11705 [Phthorimaea operculella]